MDPGPRFLFLLLAALLAVSPTALAADPHVLFETRCGACHEHAGPFARETLTLDGEVVRGAQTGRDMADFLPRHRGALTPEETALLLDMFRRQIAWGGLFQARCRACHQSARGLARHHLIVRDGVLRGRYSGRDIAAFLAHHGRTDGAEREVLVELLLWHLEVLDRVDAVR